MRNQGVAAGAYTYPLVTVALLGITSGVVLACFLFMVSLFFMVVQL